MNQKPVHAPLTQFPFVDDQLIIGGMSLKQLLEKTGSTPLYVYDSKAVQHRVAELRQVLPQGLKLHYAVKANPFQPVVNLLAGMVDGLDIASAGELELAVASGMAPHHISFAGPGKTDAELSAAINAGITLNVESLNELRRIADQGIAASKCPRVALRVNPDFELKSSGMKMSGGAKPFGIDAELIPGVLQQVKSLEVEFRGLHIFSGSQNLRSEQLVEAQNATFELASRIAREADTSLPALNIGGGFGIPYFPGERPLDIQPIADNLAIQISNWQSSMGDTEIILELGRYLVGEAGVYICQVVDKKQSRGKTYLVTNGGLHHHLAASGNFGQIIRKNYPVINPARLAQGPRDTVTIVGPLCTPLDILADNIEIGQTEVGDHIAVLQSGAYGYSASPHDFLSHPAAGQYLV